MRTFAPHENFPLYGIQKKCVGCCIPADIDVALTFAPVQLTTNSTIIEVETPDLWKRHIL